MLTYTYLIGLGGRTRQGDLIEPGAVQDEVANWFEAATIIQGNGIWKGETEPAHTILITDMDLLGEDRVRDFAVHLRDVFNQDAVLFLKQPVIAELV